MPAPVGSVPTPVGAVQLVTCPHAHRRDGTAARAEAAIDAMAAIAAEGVAPIDNHHNNGESPFVTIASSQVTFGGNAVSATGILKPRTHEQTINTINISPNNRPIIRIFRTGA